MGKWVIGVIQLSRGRGKKYWCTDVRGAHFIAIHLCAVQLLNMRFFSLSIYQIYLNKFRSFLVLLNKFASDDRGWPPDEPHTHLIRTIIMRQFGWLSGWLW